MVSLNDLMSGNVLLHRGEWVMAIIICPELLLVEKSLGLQYYAPIEEFEGIPLTVELMQRLGWIAGESMAGMTVCAPKGYSDDRLVFNEDGQIKWADANGGQPIQYLHELQNIYYWTHRKHLPV